MKFNEDYVDPNGDGSKLWSALFVGVNPTVAYVCRQPRVDQPGTKFVYKTGDTCLAAILLSNTVGKSMSEYLSEKLWQP
ncbi:serine hydrolase [Bradyrhizobium sp. CB82]|uniref:serine hydrolase n=1 Tax=Bradyrhizobium sp. CB82 TaxID=3039159 RepID=UPI0024B23F53|nr:serine hydrolase [Bradyrhizobium sp. CB82]WFU39978.1 serine hydrolase [Bradyrhizobium sp. CB82]